MEALKTRTKTLTKSFCLGHEPSKNLDPDAIHFFDAFKASVAENSKENGFEPVELLAALKTVAKLTPVILELGKLKSWLAAFYRAKGGYQLPSYYEPRPVPGLEDDINDLPICIINYSCEVDSITDGPIEEDWLSPPIAHKFGQSSKEGNFTKEGANLGTPASLSGMRKRKGSDEAVDDMKTKVENAEKAKAKLGRPATSSCRKTRDVGDEALGCGSNDSTSKLRRRNRTTLSESPVAAEEKGSEEVPGNEISHKSGPQAAKQYQDSIIDSMKVKAPANAVLSHIRFAAFNPLYLKESNSLDMVEGFVSAFRSSIYCNGSNYETYKQHERDKRRRSQECEPAPVATGQNEAADSSSNNEFQRKRLKKSEEAHSGKPNIQRIVRAPDAEEEAFNQCQLASPFGEASVTYRLQHLSAEIKTHEFKELSNPKTHPSAKKLSKIPEKPPDSQSSAVDVSRLEYVMQRLKELKYVIPDRFKLI